MHRHSPFPQLFHKSYQHNGIRYHNANQQQKAHQRRHTQSPVGNPQGDQGPGYGQRQAQHDDKGIPQRPQAGDHHQIDQGNADAHRQKDVLKALGHLGKYAAGTDFHSRRQIDSVNHRLGSVADRLGVDGGNGAGDGSGTIAVKAADRHRPLFNGNPADGAEFYIPQRPLHRQVFQAVEVVGILRPAAHHHIHRNIL